MAPLILLDAYPIVAFLVDEPAAAEVQALLDRSRAAATSVNLAEAVDVACRVHGLREQQVQDAVELLAAADLLTVTAPDAAVAIRASRLRIDYYRRRERPLSIADCFLLATAGPGDSVATADPAIAEVARSEGIRLLPLPDSSGHRP